jgi:hypothetical protein
LDAGFCVQGRYWMDVQHKAHPESHNTVVFSLKKVVNK